MHYEKIIYRGTCILFPRTLVNDWQELYGRLLDVPTALMWLAMKGIDHEKDSPVEIKKVIEEMMVDEIAKFKMLTGLNKPKSIEPQHYDYYSNQNQAYAYY